MDDYTECMRFIQTFFEVSEGYVVTARHWLRRQNSFVDEEKKRDVSKSLHTTSRIGGHTYVALGYMRLSLLFTVKKIADKE